MDAAEGMKQVKEFLAQYGVKLSDIAKQAGNTEAEYEAKLSEALSCDITAQQLQSYMQMSLMKKSIAKTFGVPVVVMDEKTGETTDIVTQAEVDLYNPTKEGILGKIPATVSEDNMKQLLIAQGLSPEQVQAGLLMYKTKQAMSKILNSKKETTMGYEDPDDDDDLTDEELGTDDAVDTAPKNLEVVLPCVLKYDSESHGCTRYYAGAGKSRYSKPVWTKEKAEAVLFAHEDHLKLAVWQCKRRGYHKIQGEHV